MFSFATVCSIIDSGKGATLGVFAFFCACKSEFEAICEIADSRAGYNPELLAEFDNKLCDYAPEAEDLMDIIRVLDVSDTDLYLCNDMKKERILCYKG